MDDYRFIHFRIQTGVHVLAKDKLQKYESYLDWKSAAWTCINNVGGPLVNLDKVPFNWTVWDKLKTAIAPGDLYWIGGYKAHTPFFWLYGCYDFIPHVENSTKYSMLFDNSVRTCSENCGSNVTFIGLKGFLCYCIHNDVSSIKSLLASKCDNKCINDVSSRDVCGSLDGSVSIYKRRKFQTVRSKFTWKRATSNCESQGMYLAYVTEVSTTTNALFNTIPSGLKVWVGLYRHDIQLWLEDDKTLLEPKSCTVVYRDAGSTALKTKTTDCSDPLKPICQASMTLTADGPDIGTPAPTTMKTTTDGYVQDTTVQDTTVQDTTVQDTTVQDTTVQDTTVQDTTVQDTTVQDTTVQDTTVQDTTVQDTTVQDTTEGPKQTKTTEMLVASTKNETAMEETTTPTESQDTLLASTTYSDIMTDSQSTAAVSETTHSSNTEASTLSATTETYSTPEISSAPQTMSTLPDTTEKTSIPVTTYDLTTLASTLSSTAVKTTAIIDEITTEYTTVLTDETTTNMPTTPEITTEETTTWMPTTKITTQEETTASTFNN
ncbi:hypothetical protein FSP39_013526 [Pinctada imbricata]|uniref:WSC domain-containing protein n=1 Tax=Pinctada imbricata TaxID=66713 RepID=A0AA88Y4D1_PINIB|nr:hypothetical protein FSP39_013526 [Pinctada imbricata]